VLARLTLPADDAAVARAFSQRPEGGGFATDLDPNVLQAAEQLGRRKQKSALENGGVDSSGGLTDPGREAGEADRADESPAAEPAPRKPGAPAPPTAAKNGPEPGGVGRSAPDRAVDRALERAPETVEIVIVIVPRGTLRTKGALSPR